MRKHRVNALLLAPEVGTALRISEPGVVYVQFEALLGFVEIGVVAVAAVTIQGYERMTTGRSPIRTFAVASATSSARGGSFYRGP